jgi:hypothetical protein
MPLGTVVLRNECLLSWQLEALKGQHSDLSQQLGALRSGAVPKQEELDQIQNLDKEIAEGESLLTDLNRKSKKLREKVKGGSFTEAHRFFDFNAPFFFQCSSDLDIPLFFHFVNSDCY